MILKELITLLSNIMKTHPESADAQVWVQTDCGLGIAGYVGYDKKHKPSRVKIEE